MISPPSRTWRRRAFVLYACILFTLTHWPNFGIDTEFGRPDLLAHAVAFGTWTILLGVAAFFGPPRSPRNLAPVAAIGVVYACVDEGLQALPVINRHASWLDLAANLFGVALGLAILAGSGLATRTGESR